MIIFFSKIICIGAPRLHEYLKGQYTSLHMKSILLDLDQRFYSFFNRNGCVDFFHYNMMNNYFFGGELAKHEFQQFFKCSENEKCCIFTDPPFGCRTELLVSTLQSLNREYRTINQCQHILPNFWIFPYFMESYITIQMPEMTMFDYKVDYTNHESYHSGENGRKQGSPVRIFSNILPSSIQLPTNENYRRCKKCDKWVAVENKHCTRCKICPSKNGNKYTHCLACENCVKPSYKHCYNCWRCTQIENHQCKLYQSKLKCMICLLKGHNEINCHRWFEICGRNFKEIIKLKSKVLKTGRRICLLCFKTGHNEAKCTKRTKLLKEISFLNQNYNLLSSELL